MGSLRYEARRPTPAVHCLQMPLHIPRLRRWFAAGAIAAVLVVAGAYFYAKHRIQDALKQVPEKIGLEIQQSANGFTVSRSEQGRTLFKIQASKAIQFKLGGRAELHDVTITLFGRDSTRFDQIYGSVFDYDPQSGDVTAKGEVQIDLESNPEGLTKPDQAPPKELKNPIHLKTSGLIFNQKTGDTYTKEKVLFSVAQANGSAVGAKYTAKDNVLTLQSQVNIIFNGETKAVLNAEHGTITKNPRVIVLEHADLQNGMQRSQADHATLFLNSANVLQRVLAEGNVLITSEAAPPTRARARQLELLMGEQRDTLRTAILSGDVQMESLGPEPMQGTAGRVVLNFGAKNVLATVHADENVHMLQHQKPSSPSAVAQDLELTAPAADFVLASGKRLARAKTAGASEMKIRPTPPAKGPETVVTAGKFEAGFNSEGELVSVHGAPNARIANSGPGQPSRVSTSTMLDAAFIPGKGVESVAQQGNVAYVDGDLKAWADRARYTPADQILVLTGSPRIVQGGMTTTARTMRMNRVTGDALAEGEVKSTYSDLKAQPGGALLASSSPIHVTSGTMTAHRSPATALYTGNARLWQDASLVAAPSIEFDRDRRSVVATGSRDQPVSTTLFQVDKSGKSTPVNITSQGLTYADNDRKAHFDGGVLVKGNDLTITSNWMDVFLQARGQSAANQPVANAGKIDHIVAENQVIITQPGRRGTGDRLVYTASDDRFVMTGGPPSIFDAEHGKITGVSLTFFRRDDRVLVEGNEKSPTVTHTRVAR